MSNFDEDGFLSADGTGWTARIRESYAEFFSLATDTNKLCQSTLFQLTVHNRHQREIIISSLYIRCLNTFQGVLLMTERGMITQARILVRTLLETLFKLCGLVKKPDLFEAFVQEDQKNRLMLLDKFKKHHNGKLPADVNDQEIEALRIKIEADIKEKRIRKQKVEQWAAAAGLTSWYLTAYPVLSDAVHTSVRDLEEHFRLGENGEIVEFRWGPAERGIDEMLLTAIEAMHFALHCTLTFFKLQREKELEALRLRFTNLVTKLAAK